MLAASVLFFAAAVPFAKTQLAPVFGFIPVYESALVVNDLITAVLLLGQFAFLRSRALAVLSGGYLFTACMAVAHALTFPGLFSPTGLLGAGPQSTAWLYMFWHGGFPLFTIAYAWLKGTPRDAHRPASRFPAAVVAGAGAVLAAACGLALLTTIGQDALPAIMEGNRYTPLMIGVVSSVWLLSLAAAAVLWLRRPHTFLDLCLLVVMCAWLCDIALSAVLNAGRFDLGFYAGRLYGLLASGIVLVAMLTEYGKLYARLAAAYASESREHLLAQERANLELQASQERLRAEERFRKILDLAPQPIIVSDADGRILEANSETAAEFGYSREELIGQSGSILVPPRDQPARDERRNEILADVKVRSLGRDLVCVRKDGSEFPALGRVGPIQTPEGLQFVTSLVNISERKAAEEKLKRANQAYEAVNKELEAFAYSVSHDLRAPVRAMAGFSQILIEDFGAQLPPEAQEHLRVIQSEGQRMGQLIDDMLSLSRVTRTEMRREAVNLSALATEVLANLRKAEPERKVECLVAEGLTASGDGRLLRILLDNLMGNAWKFTGRTAQPRIEFGAVSGNGGNAFFVRDNGAGFDMAYVGKLFGAFQRLHRSEEFSGTGIGLAIVHRIVTRHGGRVWAESGKGQGATFHFSL